MAEKLPTGSGKLDSLLRGGLSTCTVTDVFGAAGTGKTQFAFQSAVFEVNRKIKAGAKLGPTVAFVDCSGSFRPERIIEIADKRNLVSEPASILDSIFVVNVRSVSEQIDSLDRILEHSTFEKCKLIVVDDVTRNFVSEYGIKGSELMKRQHELAKYARKLAYTALSKNTAILLTNTARSSLGGEEVETTGSLISQFALFRIHFKKTARKRTAELIQPISENSVCEFEIEDRGVVP